MKYKLMRMLCMFDLPVDTEKEKRAYRIFRKNLIKEGFVMIQFSIYPSFIYTPPFNIMLSLTYLKVKKKLTNS